MNIYKISQTFNEDWDTYDSAIVAAENEEEARMIHPSGEVIPEIHWALRWSPPENVTVKLIGVTIDNHASGVILASFNAG